MTTKEVNTITKLTIKGTAPWEVGQRGVTSIAETPEFFVIWFGKGKAKGISREHVKEFDFEFKTTTVEVTEVQE